jgi:hypothetical protein
MRSRTIRCVAAVLRRRTLPSLLVAGALSCAPATLSAQAAATDWAATAFADDAARTLYQTARGEFFRVERDVLSYTALVKQRMAIDLRLPIRDRSMFRQERTSRVFWTRDGDVTVQVIGARQQGPVGVGDNSVSVGSDGRERVDDSWRGDNLYFDPADERLSFGAFFDSTDTANDEEISFIHPLASDAIEHYTFRSGDTLTVSLPDGRRLSAVELQVIPRSADYRRITGSLWIETESGGVVRAAYHISKRFDAERDLPPEEANDLALVPGLFKPFTFDITLVSVEYAFWDFAAWMPLSMRIEGIATAGIIKVPGAIEVSYQVESVITEQDVAQRGGAPPAEIQEEHHFRTRSEALAYLAERAQAAGVEYELDEVSTGRNSYYQGGRRMRYLVPEDRTVLRRSPELPPPIWEDAPGFPSAEQLASVLGRIAGLPSAPMGEVFWNFNWGPQRPDLLRYNRVEGLAVGARGEILVSSFVGPVSLGLTAFGGLADRSVKARFQIDRETLQRKISLGVYRDFVPMSRDGRHLGPGNSIGALLFGRDDGEYFLATGADLRITPPSAKRAWWELRLFAEKHDSVRARTNFSIPHLLDGDRVFRPNVGAVEHQELGGSLTLNPWWGNDPTAPQAGAELFLEGAGGDGRYGRASLTLRGVLPLARRLRVAAELGGGEARGDLPVQRNWFLGGPFSLRGYDASALLGPSFLRGRFEVSRGQPFGAITAFADGGWTGPRIQDFETDSALFSVGLGLSILDGVIRADFSHGLRAVCPVAVLCTEKKKPFRFDLYFGGIF